MSRYVLAFNEIDRTKLALVGGKARGLGELSRIDGVRVPPGFCITTDAFRRILTKVPAIERSLEQLNRLHLDEPDAIRESSAELRRRIAEIPVPDDVSADVESSLARFERDASFAIRSSATAEDLPTTSFAGQQDTYLNVVGRAAILQHISRCWASLFSERAVVYRLRNSVDNRSVSMAVIVQQMVFPAAAGVLFTADPITGNRKVAVIEAGVGLGEALVSGLANADSYKVKAGEIIARTIAAKQLAIQPAPNGGTQQRAIDPDDQRTPALTDAQVVRLVQLGQRIEAHFARPQDIEWSVIDDDFYILQSRPITTLFPIPEVDDNAYHVYLSVGHQQMMTDAMKPLGISVWQMSAAAPMFTAGGRLFVDVTRQLSSPATRGALLAMIGRSDPLFGDALRTVVEREDVIASVPETPSAGSPAALRSASAPIEADPAIVDELIARNEESIATLKREIATKSGVELFDFIVSDTKELKRILTDRRSYQVFMTAMEATWWLNEKMEAWLGEKSAGDTLTQSVPNNITSEMGLALLDVADVIRPHPNVAQFLEHVDDETFLDQLSNLPGGREARGAIQAWLDKFGMRGVGEIDITRPRWSERPRMLVPLLLGNVKNFEPGEAARRFEHGRQQALAKEQDLLARLRELPDGEQKAEETRRMIARVRTFIGYREYPKFGMVGRLSVYKQALLEEARRLVRSGVLREDEDIFFLTFDEFREVARTRHVDEQVIRDRKEAFDFYKTLMPPRVLTSDGEAINGSYQRSEFPDGSLIGLAVSAGVAEGRARVILNIADAALEPGDILVTRYTDPSWTPLFVAIKGLVTEVGGLMTHGAVIAREYGLPAVVGVEGATRLIRDGQRVRLHATEGYVEILG